jgi:hypothetical protein
MKTTTIIPIIIKQFAIGGFVKSGIFPMPRGRSSQTQLEEDLFRNDTFPARAEPHRP